MLLQGAAAVGVALARRPPQSAEGVTPRSIDELPYVLYNTWSTSDTYQIEQDSVVFGPELLETTFDLKIRSRVIESAFVPKTLAKSFRTLQPGGRFLAKAAGYALLVRGRWCWAGYSLARRWGPYAIHQLLSLPAPLLPHRVSRQP
jgi:hypothetical protein